MLKIEKFNGNIEYASGLSCGNTSGWIITNSNMVRQFFVSKDHRYGDSKEVKIFWVSEIYSNDENGLTVSSFEDTYESLELVIEALI